MIDWPVSFDYGAELVVVRINLYHRFKYLWSWNVVSFGRACVIGVVHHVLVLLCISLTVVFEILHVFVIRC